MSSSSRRSGAVFHEVVFRRETRWERRDELRLDPHEHVESEWLDADEAFARVKFESNREGLRATARFANSIDTVMSCAIIPSLSTPADSPRSACIGVECVQRRFRMNKAELIENVAKTTKMTKVDAEMVLNSCFDTIKKSVKKGEDVTLIGFGTFTRTQAQGAHGPQSADGQRDQDSGDDGSEVPCRPRVQGRCEVSQTRSGSFEGL